MTLHKNYYIVPDIQVLPRYADPFAYVLTSSNSEIAAAIPGDSLTRPRIKGIKEGTAVITASLKNNPEVKTEFEVTVIDGNPEEGEYTHVLYQLDDNSNCIASLGSMDEYTCFVGERYVLQGKRTEMHRTGQEFCILAASVSVETVQISKQPDTCIIQSLDGRGAASGPTSFYTGGISYNFLAIHAGTAVLRTAGNQTVKIHVIDPDSAIAVYGNSLNLEGKIGVNYYLDIPEDELEETNIRMSFNGKDTLIHAKETMERTVSGQKLRMVSMFVSAKEMRDQIVLSAEDLSGNKKTLLNTAGEDVTDTGYVYSVAEYLNKAKKSESEKMRVLAEATDTYGKYAQIYFKYRTDTLTDLGDVSSVTSDTVRRYRAVTGGSAEGLIYAGGSLELSSDTSVRIYFKLEQTHSIDEYVFAVNGEDVIPEKKNDELYSVSFRNIAAQNLDKTITVIAEKGPDMISVVYHPLSYAYSALTSTTAGEEIKNTVRALYLYNQAAVQYFSK